MASVCVEDMELPIVLSYTLNDSKVLSMPINVISRSKEVLSLYRYMNLQIELSAVCLSRIYRELDTLLPTLIIMNSCL